MWKKLFINKFDIILDIIQKYNNENGVKELIILDYWKTCKPSVLGDTTYYKYNDRPYFNITQGRKLYNPPALKSVDEKFYMSSSLIDELYPKNIGVFDKVKTKIESYSAQEMNNTHVINSISDNINKGIDPFFRSTLTKVEINDTYPKYLLENIDKYKDLIK